jgi:hypothetical protein
MFGKVIAGQPPPMVIEYAFDPVHPPKPVAVIVKLDVPLSVGVPLRTPVAGFNDRPGGSVLLTT